MFREGRGGLTLIPRLSKFTRELFLISNKY